MNNANAPPETGRLFYAIEYREDGTADVFLMPKEGVQLAVTGIDPWDGMEEDIRARYYAWCESAVVTHIEEGRIEHGKPVSFHQGATVQAGAGAGASGNRRAGCGDAQDQRRVEGADEG